MLATAALQHGCRINSCELPYRRPRPRYSNHLANRLGRCHRATSPTTDRHPERLLDRQPDAGDRVTLSDEVLAGSPYEQAHLRSLSLCRNLLEGDGAAAITPRAAHVARDRGNFIVTELALVGIHMHPL